MQGPGRHRELLGEGQSLTLLINGQDVTGRQLGECISCRLDLPTEDQVVAALGCNHT